MSAAQWAVVAFLVALTPAITGYAAGWWNGRRCLRADLAPHLRSQNENPAVADTVPLPVAGRFPAEPPLLWSEHKAALQGTERAVRAMIATAEEAIPARWR